ncbi:hypothetical protein ACFL6O_01425 [candidate division KSB1 bacterium]
MEIPEPGYQGYDYDVMEVKATISGEYTLEYSTNSLSDMDMYINPIFYVHYTDNNPAPPPLTVAGDYDGDGINDAEELQIAEQFRPILIKATNVTNNDKQVELADFEETINNDCILKQTKLSTGQTYFYYNTTNLHKTDGCMWTSYGYLSYNQSTQLQYWADFTLPNAHVGASYHNVSKPLYYHVYKEGSYYYVQYWMWFNSNDISDQTWYHTWHEGDWEHITVQVNKVGSSYVAERVNLYQHEGGHTKVFLNTVGKWSTSGNTPSNVQIGYDSNHTHPVIYVASNAHACYFYNDLVYGLKVVRSGTTKEEYKDVVDYNVNLSGTEGQDYHLFRFDNLEKLGEAGEFWDGYWHYYSWFEVHYWSRGGKSWNAFMGRMGDYWSTTEWFKKIATKSPYPPYHGGISHEYYDFSFNISEAGFGNYNVETWAGLFWVFKDIYWINWN